MEASQAQEVAALYWCLPCRRSLAVAGHPMKPHRIRLTHELVGAYGMLDRMCVVVSGFLLLLPLVAECVLET